MRVTLYRAADDGFTNTDTTCFGRNRSTAEAYLNYGSWGGSNLYRARLDIAPEAVLDVRDGGPSWFRRVAGGLAPEFVVAAAQDPDVVAEFERRGIRWVVLSDVHPEGAETWVLIGSDPDVDDAMEQIGGAVRSNPRNPTNPAERYKQTHWGIPHERTFTVDERVYGPKDRAYVEMGPLRAIKLAGAKVASLEFDEHDAISLAFDTEKSQRLYLIRERPATHREAEQAFRLGVTRSISLGKLSERLPGRQARYGWPVPGLLVSLIGAITHIDYWTRKKGDDADVDAWGQPIGDGSVYRHKLGEESGIRPVLAVDADARFWIVGGNYTVPAAGITD